MRKWYEGKCFGLGDLGWVLFKNMLDFKVNEVKIFRELKIELLKVEERDNKINIENYM